MKNIYGMALVCLASASIFGGCANKDATVDFGALKSSDEKTDAAERLTMGPGFFHADAQFDEALKLNPNNPKAKFYKALLGPAMVNRGIVARVQPLVAAQSTDNSAQFNREVVNKIPTGDLHDFLFDGKPDIVTEADAQNQLRAIQDKFRNIRAVLGTLKKETITLHIPIAKPGVTQEDLASQCPVTKVSDNTYKVKDCPLVDIKDMNVNFADMEAIRLYAAGAIVYASMGTAYDMTGLMNVVNTLNPISQKRKVKDSEFVAAVQQQKSLGNLVDVNALKEVLSFGAEGVQAVRYAQANQASLCKTGDATQENRPGYMVSKGFCNGKDVTTSEKFLGVVEKMLAGPAVTPFGAPQTYETQVDVTKPLNGSVTDLKALLPTTFNNCGSANSIPDDTLGGLFPKGDATVAIRAGTPTFLNESCRR